MTTQELAYEVISRLKKEYPDADCTLDYDDAWKLLVSVRLAARKNRIQAEQWNQIQALTTSAGEALEGTDGSPAELLSLLPGGIQKEDNLIWYYDDTWQNCSEKNASYEMIFSPDTSSSEKSGELSFLQVSDKHMIYRIPLSFPAEYSEKEGS